MVGTAEGLYQRRLLRIKWAILGLAVLSIAGVKAYYCFLQGLPLAQVVHDWLIDPEGKKLVCQQATSRGRGDRRSRCDERRERGPTAHAGVMP
jgi:hypothetical protein